MSVLLPRLLSIAALVLLAAVPVRATQYSITIFDDNEASNGDCSLREAIRAAVTDSMVDACAAGDGDDVITLPLGTVVFDGGEETVGGIHGSLTILGPTGDPSSAAIDCDSQSRFLSLSAADVTLRGFTVTHCDSGSEEGGAVDSMESGLALLDMVFAANASSLRGGALRFASAGGEALRIDRTAFEGNAAEGGALTEDPYGGGAWVEVDSGSAVTVTRSIFSDNQVSSDARTTRAGGLYVSATGDATVTLRGVEFLDNRCGAFDTSHRGCGLALDLAGTAQATLEDSDFEGNHPSGTSSYTLANGAYLHLVDDASLLADRLRFDGNANPADSTLNKMQLWVHAAGASSTTARNLLAVNGQTGLYAFLNDSAAVTIDHVTATGNENGVSLYLGFATPIALQNSILWGNSSANVLVGGVGSSIDLTPNHIGGIDPLFANPAQGDYRLTASSPDRDDGVDSLEGAGVWDLDHAPRSIGAKSDKGAYEFGGVFADGFESGDVISWSSSVP